MNESPTPTPGGGYPVHVLLDPTKQTMNRLWGIPFLGVIIRAILAIPLFIVLAFAGILLYFVVLVSWIPILATGRQAGWIYGLFGFYLDWSARGSAYVWLLISGYPMSADCGARVVVDRDQQFNRLWGVPLLGLLVRAIVLIPHYVVLFFLGIGAGILLYLSWIPVLAYGRQADLVVNIVGGYLRWGARVGAYLLLIADPYPPFRLED